MRPRNRTLLRGAGFGALLLVALAVLSAIVLVRATVTPLSGALTFRGLSGRAEIVRDKEAVPHIFAATIPDAYAALGFAHAQDRLFQMELSRRAAQGRLSEVFGPRTLDVDIYTRTLDLYGYAERALGHLSPNARAMIEAYARGVNAFLQRETAPLEARYPPEFLLLRYKPEPWRAADCLAVLKMMALTLGGNLRKEVSRLTYAAQGLTPAEIADIMPPVGQGEAVPLPDLRQLFALRPPIQHSTRSATLDPAPVASTGASNNWVVAGTRTSSGAPLLANDPHLGLSVPSIWYLVHMSLPNPGGDVRIEIAGASLPGTPLVPLGRGTTLAWGATNTEADVQDLFIERVDPERPDHYQTPDGWQPFVAEKMVIDVRGGPARIIERRRTRHGPVLPPGTFGLDDILPRGYVAALKWTALDDDDPTIEAGLINPGMRTVADYVETLRPMVGPVQSFAVADTVGNIAIVAPGRIPIRKSENMIGGRAPVPGWDATYDWHGFIPWPQLPGILNPAAGAVGTANSDLIQQGYPYRISWDWDWPYRQQRIEQLVVAAQNHRHDVATMRQAQLDDLSLAALELKPLMIAAARQGGSRQALILDDLATWDSRMAADLKEPLIYMAWMREAIRAIYADDLGPTFDRFFAPQAPVLVRLLSGRAKGRDWCDDLTTAAHETCGQVIAAALDRALEFLDVRLGSNRQRWTWGAVHVAVADNQVWSKVPLIGGLFEIRKPADGGPYTLSRNTASFATDTLFESRMGSTYRAIYDLSDLDRSLYMQPTGQSGNPFSRYYRNFADRWARGDYIRIPTARAEIEQGAIGTWRLEPQASSPGS